MIAGMLLFRALVSRGGVSHRAPLFPRRMLRTTYLASCLFSKPLSMCRYSVLRPRSNWKADNLGSEGVPFIFERNFNSCINRLLASDKFMSETDVKREIEQLTEKFMEARELLEDAVESKGTVYFEEDLKDAHAAIEETLSKYEEFLVALDPEQKQKVLRTIGLKMEELKAQERSILDELKED